MNILHNLQSISFESFSDQTKNTITNLGTLPQIVKSISRNLCSSVTLVTLNQLTTTSSRNEHPITSTVLGKRLATPDPSYSKEIKCQKKDDDSFFFRSVDKREFIFAKTLEKMRLKNQKTTMLISNIISRALKNLEDILASKCIKVLGNYIVLRENKSSLTIIPFTFKPKMIGEGSFATVYLSENLVNGRKIVWKVAKKSNQSANKYARNECFILKAIYQRAKNLGLKVEGIQKPPKAIFEIDGDLVSLFSFYDQGDLLEKVMRGVDAFTLSEKIDVMKQLLSSLALLSRLGLGHGDLKLENILLRCENKKWKAYIADFGGAKFYDQIDPNDLEFLKKPCGIFSPLYAPKEDMEAIKIEAELGSLARFECLENKRGVFAMGTVLHCLFCGSMPFDVDAEKAVIVKEKLNTKCLKKMNVSNDIIKLIEKMLKKNPDERISVEDAFLASKSL